MKKYIKIKLGVSLGGLLIVMSLSAQNFTRPNITGPGGVNVNSFTGNLYLKRSDFSLEGRMPIAIFFSYNSTDYRINRGYGRGWMFSYGTKLMLQNDTVTVIRNDGRKDLFTPGTDNVLTPPKGIFDSLKIISPGVYQLRSPDGIKYHFGNSAHNRITKVEDRNGNFLQFTYTDSLVTSISDNAGRTIQLIYNNGRLTSLIEANGAPTRTYSYQYDNNGNLKRVTDPMGFYVEYGYAVNGPMNVVKDKNANAVDIIYNESFAVKEIVSCLTKQAITYNIASRTTYVTELVGTNNQLTSYKFDENKNVIQKTGNCCGFNVKYEYDKDKNVSKMTDANGKIYQFTYDNRGKMLSKTDPLGNSSMFTYENTYSQILSIKDPNANITSYNYDGKGNLLQIKKPLSITESFSYAANGDLLSYTDARGGIINITYDNYGNIATINRPLGSNFSLTYDSKSRLLSETDPLNHTNTYSYDGLDRLVSYKNALNIQQTFIYDKNANVTSFTNANNQTTQFSYDALDRRIKTTDALGKIRLMSYDAKDNLITMSNENGHTTSYSYGNLNRKISETNPTGETIQFSYDAIGNEISRKEPNGNIVTSQYDMVNRIIGMSDLVGTIILNTYDNNGNLISEADGTGNVTSYSYDELNRIKTITDALGFSTSYNYDANSNTISKIDKNGYVTTHRYDELDRKLSTKTALNDSTRFIYNSVGNLVSTIDANGFATSYSYDPANRLTNELFANGTGKTYAYDGEGNMLSRLDGNGITTSFIYDAVNRLLKADYPGTNDNEFTFDNAGRLLSATNANAVVSFTYDPADRILSETLNGRSTAYQYNTALGKRTLTYPGGRIIERFIDKRDRLIAVKESGASIADFVYDIADRNTGINFRNNVQTSISYDVLGRVLAIISNPGSFQNLSYGYDKLGNKLFEKKVTTPSASHQYGYDNINRVINYKEGTLVGQTIPSPVKQILYNYDALGNRKSVTSNSVVSTYNTNNVNAYTSVVGTTTITPSYDGNGNITFDGNLNHVYDAENKLTAISGSVNGTYLYDALGRRIRKTTNSVAVNYYYSFQQIIEERNAADNVSATYVYGTNIDQVLNMNRNNNSYYYHSNHLGSVYAVTNDQANVMEKYDYDAYGNVTMYDGANTIITSSAVGNVFFFTGRQLDIETNNYQYRFRDYSSSLGRFKQRDPLDLINGEGHYEFVNSNPGKFTDPMGLQSEPKCKINPETQRQLDDLSRAMERLRQIVEPPREPSILGRLVTVVEQGNNYAEAGRHAETSLKEDIKRRQKKCDAMIEESDRDLCVYLTIDHPVRKDAVYYTTSLKNDNSAASEFVRRQTGGPAYDEIRKKLVAPKGKK